MTNWLQKADKMIVGRRDGLVQSLPDFVEPERFVDVARTALRRNEKLLRSADPDTVYVELKRCARSGLMPDGEESTFIIYDGQAQWTPMVQGIVRLILRSPGVEKVESRVVRKGDHFEFGYGLKQYLDHVPSGENPSEDDFDPTVTHSYAIVYRGTADPQFEVLHREEIERARETAAAPTSPAWRNWYPEMARKVAVHRIRKYIDLAPEARDVIRQDIAAGWDPDRPKGRSPGREIEAKARDQGERVAADLGAAEGKEASGSEGGSPASEASGEDGDGSATLEAPDPSPEGEPESVDDGAEDEPQAAEEDAGGEGPEDEGRPVSERLDELPTLAEFGESQGWSNQKLNDRLTFPDEADPLPEDYAIVHKGASWFHPVIGSSVVDGINLRKLEAVIWCRRHKASEMYDVEEPDEDWRPDDEKVEEMRRKLTGEEDEGADESEDDVEDESDDDTSELGFDEMPDPKELSPEELRAEMIETVRRTPGWEFPGFLIRFATDLFLDRVKDGDDSIPTEKGYADPRKLTAEDTRELASELREAARRKAEEGEDPEFRVKSPNPSRDE